MTDPRQLIEQLFHSFNRRSQEGMRALCDEGVELTAVTAELVVVVGRVYARSRRRGMRDLPAVWVWRLRGGRFAEGRLLADSAPRVPAPAGQAETGDP